MLLAADNIHGLNPAVAEAMKRLDPHPIRELARLCHQAGAGLIDINPGYLSPRNEDRMAFLVEAVQEATPLRLILDSPNPRVLAKGLAVCTSRPVLNALSLEPEKLQEILPLAVEHRTTLVVLLMDERSFAPPRVEEKIALAAELRERAMNAGLAHEDLIFDPVLPNLAWEDAFLRVGQDVKTVRLLASGAIFQDLTETMVGLSNLLSGHPRGFPPNVEQTCLSLLAGAGLSHVLANVLKPGLVDAYRNIMEIIG